MILGLRMVCIAATLLTLNGCVTKRMSSAPAIREGIETGFLNRRVVSEGKDYPYVVYVPRNYDPARPWPLILFLHGAGERGSDGLKQTEVGLGPAIRRNADWFPAIVCMPQCPERMWWHTFLDPAKMAFDATLREFTIDLDRIYLTGISMGGYGTWYYGAEAVERFAALMPICGGGRASDAAKLATIPIWAFHGADDDVVKPIESRRMVDAIRQQDGDIQYTEFEGVQHNSWDKAYQTEEHIRWLFDQRRNTKQ